MLNDLFGKLREKLGSAEAAPPASLLGDETVVLGLRRAQEGFAERVREMLSKVDENAPAEAPRVKTIGGYEIVRELGRGGMGSVFLARDDKGRRVVIKVPFTQYGADPKYIEIFFREFQALFTARHENIVQVYSCGRDVALNVYYYVAEHVRGVSLKDLLEAYPDKRFTPTEAAAVSTAVIRALRFLSEKGVAHRDIKPGNIMFDSDGRVKLIDFGSAKIGEKNSKLTESGVRMGSFDYMAPEVGLEEAPTTPGPERDIYSLGVVHYQLLKRALPRDFGGGREGMIAFARFCQAHTPPLESLSGIDKVTRRLLLRMTERKPAERLVDFDEIERTLALVIKSDGGRV